MSKTFHFLLQLAQDKEEQAAKIMQSAQVNFTKASNKLNQLNDFVSDYQAQLFEKAQSGLGKEQWIDYQAFMQKLYTAQQSQVFEVSRAKDRYEQTKIKWQEARKEIKAFEVLIERDRIRTMAEQQKKEQKLSDEFAARSFWNQNMKDK